MGEGVQAARREERDDHLVEYDDAARPFDGDDVVSPTRLTRSRYGTAVRDPATAVTSPKRLTTASRRTSNAAPSSGPVAARVSVVSVAIVPVRRWARTTIPHGQGIAQRAAAFPDP